jgi:hypothetical protein
MIRPAQTAERNGPVGKFSPERYYEQVESGKSFQAGQAEAVALRAADRRS